MSKEKNPYLPKMRTDYEPSSAELESGTGSDVVVGIPSPIYDPVVVNNKTCQEFDYMEDPSDMENFHWDLNEDKNDSEK